MSALIKDDLQIRAERAAEQFAKTARKPLVIEFAGVPKAGKTTTLTQVQAFLKRCGFRIEVVVERASVCPIRDKKHPNFNVWTSCMTLAQILEKTQDPPRADDPHILILDRGIFDAICWITMMEWWSRIRPTDREIIDKFLQVDDWRKRISAVILMIASPEDALKRERGVLPAVKEKIGSIMNLEVLQQIKKTNIECAERLKNKFRVYQVNTSFGETKDNPQRTAEVVTDLVLNMIEEQIEEKILFLPKTSIVELFQQKCFLDSSRANALALLFKDSGDFGTREKIEADRDLVQALPIVIIRNASGAVLQLRRREKSHTNPLHDKMVIWAGGHVRREDASNGDVLLQCAMRELGEELRLNVERESLRLVGAVYSDTGERIAKHVAIAYEWRAATDDVAMVLSRAEFFERRGTSLSGRFVSIENLARDVKEERISEPWSVELVREYLAKNTFPSSSRLF